MDKVELKYPVLMVHGMGFRDHKRINYWGRIPRVLEEMGCRIYYGGQDSNGSIETNAAIIAAKIEEIIKNENVEKVNIIAHSKGGLDSRYAISALGMGDKVASLTTLSTPHHGSVTMDKLIKIPAFIMKTGCFFADVWFRILGDKRPATYKVLRSFTTAEAEKFNERCPDGDSVYYQSYAFVMKRASSDMFMFFTSLFVSAAEGENDGLLTPDRVKWGEFRGVVRSAGRRGISHCDEVDMRRRPLSKRAGEGISDITEVYKKIITDLSYRGL